MTIYKRCDICGRLTDYANMWSAEPYKKGLCCQYCKVKVVDASRRNYRIKGKKY